MALHYSHVNLLVDVESTEKVSEIIGKHGEFKKNANIFLRLKKVEACTNSARRHERQFEVIMS